LAKDFKTWTFHLRKDTKWSNGDPVTAHDFVFAWRRLVDPATAAPYASYLSYLQVENAQDIIDGKKKPAELGVEAKDDYTFVVHATNPIGTITHVVFFFHPCITQFFDHFLW